MHLSSCYARHHEITLPYYLCLGQLLVPEQLYAIYSDARISNISLAQPPFNDSDLQPSQQLTIPLSCDNPLLCGSIDIVDTLMRHKVLPSRILTQQKSLSEIYIPNEGNSSLFLLRIEDDMLYTHTITTPCVFNDFALQSNNDDYPLLIACVLTENDDHIRYVLSNKYGNVTRNGTESVPLQRGVVSPIILTLSNDDEVDVNPMWIISINTQNTIVVFKPGDSKPDTLPLMLDQSCVPVRIQKVRSDVMFLLTCEGGQSHLVNVSVEPVSAVSLPNSTILAITNNGDYSLALTMINSTATVTIHESQSEAHQLIATKIFGADFGPDDKFAYIATDKGIDFINIVMALEGAPAENFTHSVNTMVCPECPPVVFLNSTIALVSSVGSSKSQIQIQLQTFDLSSWPPVNLVNRTLNDQPKLYWYDNQYIQPTLVTPSLTPSVTPTDARDKIEENPPLSDGAIGGIAVSAVGIAIAITIIIIIIIKSAYRLKGHGEHSMSR